MASNDSLKLLLKSIRRENSDLRWFVPHNALVKVMVRENLRSTLKDQIKPYHIEETLKSIIRTGTKIFAILVLIDHVPKVQCFIEKDQLRDQRLPFTVDELKTIVDDICAIDFFEKQSEFLVPEFFQGMLTRRLNERTVMPFTKDSRIGAGSFGKVYEICFHPDHQLLEPCFQQRLVRKEIEDENMHEVELENLSILSLLKHPNILDLLASYKHKGKCNLIFPYASGGNLADTLSGQVEQPQLQHQENMWIAIAGLASGIEAFHDFVEEKVDLRLTGFHHDLRPRNILISGDKLILADFGLSRFKNAQENSDTNFKIGSGDYIAPECEDIEGNFEKFRIHRSSDIWSLGCILIETGVYLSFGVSELSEFRKERKFKVPSLSGRYRTFSLFHYGLDKENPTVCKWLCKLDALGQHTFHKFVELCRKTLNLDHNRRPKAREVASKLQEIATLALYQQIDELFISAYLPKEDSPTDCLFEHIRFRGWFWTLYGDLVDCLPHFSITDFENVIDILRHMRNQLNGILSIPRDLPSPWRAIGHLNDQLYQFLSPQQQQICRAWLTATLTREPSVSLDSAPYVRQKDIRIRVSLGQMNHLANEHLERDKNHRQLNPSDIEIGSRFGDHNFGTIDKPADKPPVLIEWRTYNLAYVDERVNQEMFSRVELITDLLGTEKPGEFRSLNCKGFFHDVGRRAFGMVFDLPSPYPLQIEPISLGTLITRTQRISSQPVLDGKFRLAYILARAILEFHSVAWLHKRLNSSNIAFFPNAGESVDDYVCRPFIIGFNHSRPNDPKAFTHGFSGADEKFYQHPVYLSGDSKYIAEYDYYSLGLVLLEIGLWGTLEDFGRKYLDASAEAMRKALISSRVPLLGKTMGLMFQHIVQTCLESRFCDSVEEQNEDISVPVILAFNNAVVSQLRKACLALDSSGTIDIDVAQ
ncbi:kinase-like protein [Lindgomyces ingoldianus]|uniref:Kinase-like protein n=1 Tax=Lindgomyces ingoldianus TaxID=673940 RepID=A0ACB6QQ89_9PLEO|nr:kinase-like protein [Lindgomyces ingoldianus]KAF2468700.1 kinase-like protein [Lindgomyces ingoldianus]